MPQVYISPVYNTPNIQDSDGNPLSGGHIYAYEAGSNSILKNTYTDSTGDVANPNPIVLDSSGNYEENIWLEAGEYYNLVLTDSSGTTVIRSIDNVSGVLTATSGGDVALATAWNDLPAVYLSPTQFLIVGNYDAQFPPGIRVRVTLGSGYVYGLVTASEFSAPNTTVTIINDGSAIDSSITNAAYSILEPSPGAAVDAGGVSYFSTVTYSQTNTVGNQLNAISTTVASNDTAVRELIARSGVLYASTGTDDYTITVTPAPASYPVQAMYGVYFGNSSTGTPRLRVNSLAYAEIRQYNSAAELIEPTIHAGQLGWLLWDNTHGYWILTNPVPNPDVVTPHGMVVVASNSTWTCPDHVYYARITCVGGGGGGGSSLTYTAGDSGYFTNDGGNGGAGGVGVRTIDVVPGTTYLVTIGSGGTGTTADANQTGGTGGPTTFGASLVQATGGTGGRPGNFYTTGANGNPGYGNVAGFTTYKAVMSIGNSPKGVGGVTNSPGVGGMMIIEY